MKVFPSNNEKTITVVIVTFLFGAISGIFASGIITDKNILLPAIATLAAAFLGAWAAYKLQDNKNKRAYREKCLESANLIIFALYERLYVLKLFQRDSIEPHRNNPMKMIAIMPLLDFRAPESEFKVETLLFLLGTKHKQLILDLHTEKECFKEAFKLIEYRSRLHLEHVQPAMENGGIQEGEKYTKQQFIDAMGERIFAQLERTTDSIIENVDKSVISGEKIKVELVKTLKAMYPNENIFNFEFMGNNA